MKRAYCIVDASNETIAVERAQIQLASLHPSLCNWRATRMPGGKFYVTAETS